MLRAQASSCKMFSHCFLKDKSQSRNLNMKNSFFYFQKKNQSNLWFQTNRTRIRANYFNTQKNNEIYSNLFLALIYMQVGKNHTSLFHRGSFSVFLLRSRFTAGLFSFFASFGFFVFVPSVAVPFFTVVTTSAVTKGREKKQPSNNCMMLQAPFNCRIPKKTAFAFVFANWHLLLFRPM